MFNKNYSFEPRVGKVQKIFGICYLVMTATGLALAFYAKSRGMEPYLQYFMTVLFLIMAGKSFFISHRVNKLVSQGIPTTACLQDVTPVRGITIIHADIKVPDFGTITIEHRLAGTAVAEEIKQWCADNGSEVKALLIGAGSKRPRGMLLMRTIGGHLDPDSLRLESTANQKDNS